MSYFFHSGAHQGLPSGSSALWTQVQLKSDSTEAARLLLVVVVVKNIKPQSYNSPRAWRWSEQNGGKSFVFDEEGLTAQTLICGESKERHFSSDREGNLSLGLDRYRMFRVVSTKCNNWNQHRNMQRTTRTFKDTQNWKKAAREMHFFSFFFLLLAFG